MTDNGKTFHGVEVDWMQAQWRDCLNRDKQLQIFVDMTGARKKEILAVLGEIDSAERGYHRYSAEDDAMIVRMVAQGETSENIAKAIGVDKKSVENRRKRLRQSGMLEEHKNEIKETEEKPMEKETEMKVQDTTARDIAALVSEFVAGRIAERKQHAERIAEIDREIAMVREAVGKPEVAVR